MVIEIRGIIHIGQNEEGKANLRSGKELESILADVIDLFNAMSSKAASDEIESMIGNAGSDIEREDPEITVRFTNRPYDVDRERRRCL